MCKKLTARRLSVIAFGWCIALTGGLLGQSITISGTGTGRTFDGVGGVSGGGATSALLMSYPEPQRSQILDLLFKPNFGASIQTHFCEVPGDANSTQGSELSHMHTANDLNCQRGYEWFIMKEAYKRNQAITFDGVAWGCPGWVGNGNFWSTDMQNYYIKWIQGLKTTYGISLDAIGCKNESGSNTSWLIQFHNALNTAGLSSIRVHGMDDWNGVQAKWGVADQLAANPSLRDAIDVLSAHTTINTSWSETKVDATDNAKNSGKPLWDTEEHFMNQNYGYNQVTAVVNAFNSNYIRSRVTKTLFWYLVCSTYPIEPWGDYGIMTAQEPWSGNYFVKPGVWGYAHYNQFAKVGWKFIDGACGNLTNGGTYVALKSPDNADYSIIIETKGVPGSTAAFTITGGLPASKTLCVWRSTSINDLFSRQPDITPVNGSFSLAVQGDAIYSISTTTGQQKGSFATVPASTGFPMPYYETFDHYGDLKSYGYLAYNFADIDGAFELTNRPDGNGVCLRQVLQQKAQSWAPEWAPYTIIGSKNWTNYEVGADVYFDNGGWAGVMGRVITVNGGFKCYPRGYYLRLSSTGAWDLYYATVSTGAGTSLASGNTTLTGQWHNVKLRLSGSTITGFIENNQVCSVMDANTGAGMAGLITGDYGTARNSAMFDNFIVNTVGGSTPQPTVFPQDANPPYGLQYTLTTSATNGSISLNPAGGAYNPGTVVTLAATPASGYAFNGWSGDLTGTTNPTTITMEANKSVTATFTATVQYSMTTSATNGTVTLNPAGGAYNPGAVVTLTATPAAGYAFSGWSGDLTGTANPAAITMSSNKSVTANFTVATTTWASDLAWTQAANGWGPVEKDKSNGEAAAGDGKAITLAGKTYAKGFGCHAVSEITVPLNKGYTSFTSDIGVDDEVGANGSVTFQVVVDGVTKLTSAVITGVSATQTVTVDVTNAATLSLKVGNGGGNNNSDHADWAGAKLINSPPVPQYTLTTSAINGIIGLNPAGGIYNSGTVVTLTVTPAAGYAFSGWSGDLTGSTNPMTITMNSNKSVIATFTPVPQYTLTTSATNGTIGLNPAGGIYNSGTVVTLTATPAAGYAFSGWSGDLTGMTNPTTITMNTNKSVTATFSATPTIITFEAENLARTATAAGSQVVTGATGASNNSYVQFAGTPVAGDWLEFTLPGLATGTYTIKMYFKSNNNRCICQGSVDGANLGGTCDEYQAAAAFQVMFSMGSKALAAGDHKIRFTVTGKNAASSGYTLTIDKIVLTR